MNKRNENRGRMIKAVLSVLNKFQDLWIEIPLFQTIVNEINEKQVNINKLRDITEVDITGKTSDKNQHEEKMLQELYTISSNLCVVAQRAGKQELYEKIDFTMSELSHTREPELVNEALRVVELARQNMNILAPCDTNEEQINSLETMANEMKDKIADPRVSLSERKTANQNLKKELDAVVLILKEQLDRLMVRFKISHPGFFAEYMNARHVVAYGIRHESEDAVA